MIPTTHTPQPGIRLRITKPRSVTSEFISPATKQTLASIVSTLDGLQRTRIQQGNRMIAVLKSLLGEQLKTHIKKFDVEGEITELMSSKILKLVEDDYRQFVKEGGAITTRANFDKNSHKLKVIRNYEAALLISAYVQSVDNEDRINAALADVLKGHPLWEACQMNKGTFYGIGPKVIAVLVAYIDIEKAINVSKIVKYAGLDVVINPETGEGEGRGRYKHHLVPKTYTKADGEVVETMGISYNPYLKKILLGVCAVNMIKLGAPSSLNRNTPSIYYTYYQNYKHRIKTREDVKSAADPEYKRRTDRHIDFMARRFMIKFMLLNVYRAWRSALGLPVYKTYAEEMIHMQHHQSFEIDYV